MLMEINLTTDNTRDTTKVDGREKVYSTKEREKKENNLL